MNASAETKTCPMCAETVKAAAKKCPFCQTRLGRWVLWHVDLVPALVSSCVIIMAFSFLAWGLSKEANLEGRSFTDRRSDLRVVRATVEPDRTQPGYRLLGFVTNSGNYPWRIRRLEVRLLDPQGNLVDVLHPKLTNSFVVEPGDERAFTLGLGALPSTNFASAPLVRVDTATDGRRSADP
jgi:hypothetical protein